MSKKKVCFIAQFPPPIHGLSKAVDTLYNSELAQKFEFEKIDITNNRKIFSNLIAIWKSKADLFYFTISQTRGGNLRDLLIFKVIGRRPCLVHLHGGYYRTMVDQLPNWQRNANYNAIAKLSGAIVLGPSLKWIFQGMIPDEKIFTVPNCVDDEYLMSDKEFQDKINNIENRQIKHVLYLSNFIKTKGYQEVLEMAKLEKLRVDAGGSRRFHFDFAGKFFEASQNDYFLNFIRDNKLEEYVTYHGVVCGNEKRELLKNCDIFVLLTTYPNEGQPISILEAMGNGMLIVTTNHAGIPDIVANEKQGLVTDREKISYAQIYDWLLKKDSYKNIALSNRLKVKDCYNQQNYIKTINTLFMNVQ